MRLFTPDMRIVVPFRDQVKTTERFLDSFDRQTVSCFLELHDDYSEHESVLQLEKRMGFGMEVESYRGWPRPYFNGIVNNVLDGMIFNDEIKYVGIVNNDVVLGKQFVHQVCTAFENSSFDALIPKTKTNWGASTQARMDEWGGHDIVTFPTHKNAVEGWCMFFRTKALRNIPFVPSDLRFWFGDDWLFRNVEKNGGVVGHMSNVFVYHEGSVTLGANNPKRDPLEDEVILADVQAFIEKYSWLNEKSARYFSRRLREIENR